MPASFSASQCQNLDLSAHREWLLPNGIGGFAMGTVSGINTRRYHGLLVGAIHPPTDRMVLLAGVDGVATCGSMRVPLSSNQYPGAIHPDGYSALASFEVDYNSAVWKFQRSTVSVEKRLTMIQGANQIELTYTNLGKKTVHISLNPLVCHRDFHANFSERDNYPASMTIEADATIIEEGGIELFLTHPKASRTPVAGWYYRFEHLREIERGLDPRDDLYCPCELHYDIAPGDSVTLIASVGRPVTPSASAADEASYKLSEQLRRAATKFLVQTKTRSSILAGYPWFSDWGRDTMISLPGVCLATGNTATARAILRDYASQMDNGLIPNRFVERGEKPDYNTVDATLWFTNAIYKTLLAEWDETFAKEMFGVLQHVIQSHMDGTHFGIKVDPADGLLSQGGSGLQLTWMDAKIGDWVVTPRHGKPVEINGLWVNLLRVSAFIGEKLGKKTDSLTKAADQAAASFEEKFWHSGRGHYMDTVEPGDASLRPNQVLAMSLPFSPCDPTHAKQALEVVERELLTPFGLRTLGPREPGYEGRFEGPVTQLDSRYHQGTVWPWLMGPYITSFVKYGGSQRDARKRMSALKEMLSDRGIDGIAECYDGDEPHRPNGCPWQAWSVAEWLRAWTEDANGE